MKIFDCANIRCTSDGRRDEKRFSTYECVLDPAQAPTQALIDGPPASCVATGCTTGCAIADDDCGGGRDFGVGAVSRGDEGGGRGRGGERGGGGGGEKASGPCASHHEGEACSRADRRYDCACSEPLPWCALCPETKKCQLDEVDANWRGICQEVYSFDDQAGLSLKTKLKGLLDRMENLETVWLCLACQPFLAMRIDALRNNCPCPCPSANHCLPEPCCPPPPSPPPPPPPPYSAQRGVGFRLPSATSPCACAPPAANFACGCGLHDGNRFANLSPTDKKKNNPPLEKEKKENRATAGSSSRETRPERSTSEASLNNLTSAPIKSASKSSAKLRKENDRGLQHTVSVVDPQGDEKNPDQADNAPPTNTNTNRESEYRAVAKITSADNAASDAAASRDPSGAFTAAFSESGRPSKTQTTTQKTTKMTPKTTTPKTMTKMTSAAPKTRGEVTQIKSLFLDCQDCECCR